MSTATVTAIANVRAVPRPSVRRPRVVLVEDADGVRRATAAALRAAGIDVTAVSRAAQALAVLDVVRPHVLVTDVSMPGMDGLELVATLRLRGVRVPILVVSARDGVADRVSAFDAGADAFLAKPFRLADLLSRVVELSQLRARVSAGS